MRILCKNCQRDVTVPRLKLEKNIRKVISGDEENGDEGQRFYRAGRMSTLFELLDNGKLSFEDICEFLGWQAEDVNDMYQGYRESRNM